MQTYTSSEHHLIDHPPLSLSIQAAVTRLVHLWLYSADRFQYHAGPSRAGRGGRVCSGKNIMGCRERSRPSLPGPRVILEAIRAVELEMSEPSHGSLNAEAERRVVYKVVLTGGIRLHRWGLL